MIRNFLRDTRGNYAMMMVIALVPIMGGLALAIDYAEMTTQRQETLNALDAANFATARFMQQGGSTDEQIKQYAKDFFEANLGSVNPINTTLTVVLPKNTVGGLTMRMSAGLKYSPYFYPTFADMMGKTGGNTKMNFNATSEVRLKNTLEVALVLDNSGSMDYTGTGSGKKRMVLLKSAAKDLIDALSAQAQGMQQISKPVQFGVVPFAASVNVGSANKIKTWMDRDGLSPIHHENFTYPTAAQQYTEVVGGIRYARGTSWSSLYKDKKLTRFALYDNMRRIVSTNSSGVNTYAYMAWEGCVEARPSPYNITDDQAQTNLPATLFVPMFAPDEPGNVWVADNDSKGKVTDTFSKYSAPNSWWDDNTLASTSGTTDHTVRQKNFLKYIKDMPIKTVAKTPTNTALPGLHEGPNESCTTTPITPLTDVSTVAGVTAVKASIDAMESNGATNVPEGMAWGWRVLSNTAPFEEGRPEIEQGNDKVVIVLTDGANTYYTPSSLGYSDPAGNKSTYSSYGYTNTAYNSGHTRLFRDTSTAVVKTDFSNDNYTKALNEHFAKLCTNAKTGGLMVMTVSLDLSTSNTAENAQINALKACSSESRVRKDASGNPAKLYWNATGGSLATTFKEIGDELSNLRLVL